MYLKVSPLRGTRRFYIQGKLVPWFVGPFRILRKIGELAYRFDLSSELTSVHPVFHVSHLKKCLRVLEEQVVPVALDIQDTLTWSTL